MLPVFKVASLASFFRAHLSYLIVFLYLRQTINYWLKFSASFAYLTVIFLVVVVFSKDWSSQTWTENVSTKFSTPMPCFCLYSAITLYGAINFLHAKWVMISSKYLRNVKTLLITIFKTLQHSYNYNHWNPWSNCKLELYSHTLLRVFWFLNILYVMRKCWTRKHSSTFSFYNGDLNFLSPSGGGTNGSGVPVVFHWSMIKGGCIGGGGFRGGKDRIGPALNVSQYEWQSKLVFIRHPMPLTKNWHFIVA